MPAGLPLLVLALAPAFGPDGRGCAGAADRAPGLARPGGRPAPPPPAVARVAAHLPAALSPAAGATAPGGSESVDHILPPVLIPSGLRVPVGRANRVTDEARGFHPTGPP